MERHEQFNALVAGFADEAFAGAPTRVKSGGGR
jgi:hypothetical protein